jgi:hypothetical protein
MFGSAVEAGDNSRCLVVALGVVVLAVVGVLAVPGKKEKKAGLNTLISNLYA